MRTVHTDGPILATYTSYDIFPCME